MANLAFDTLKLSKKLEQSGFTPDQAKGFAAALSDAFTDETVTKNRLTAVGMPEAQTRLVVDRLASKSDLYETEARIKIKIETTKVDILKLLIVAMLVFQVIAVIALIRP